MAISEVCKFEVKEEIDHYVDKKGLSRNKASKRLAEWFTEILGKEIKPGTIRQKDLRARQKLATNVATEDRPKCKKCGTRYATKKHGLCRRCQKTELGNEQYEKGKAEFDKIPVDPESEQYWLEYVDLINKYFSENVYSGKVSKGVMDQVGAAQMNINKYINKLFESSIFYLR